jgi:hypothetical protein
MLGTKHFNFMILAIAVLGPAVAGAQSCGVDDRACIMKTLGDEAAKIDNASWRDQTYRELAKTYAFEGDTNAAVALIDNIENPDTKAMTIRGIGMAAADKKHTPEEYVKIFAALREKADKIEHPPSHAIALTYIAMSQAFAKDNEGAWTTAASMENDALRHKAYGESAEIQAENGDFEAAMKSIGFIESDAYRNKAYETVTKILADKKMFAQALECAGKITNAYKKAEGLQYILDQQKPREIPHQ